MRLPCGGTVAAERKNPVNSVSVWHQQVAPRSAPARPPLGADVSRSLLRPVTAWNAEAAAPAANRQRVEARRNAQEVYMSRDEDLPAGMHHVSILTNSAERTHDFWTRTLGLQLSAKSVNQEQYGMYHLFYSDAAGAPGTLVTFFDMPLAAPLRPGTGGFSCMSLRVRDAEAVGWWADRLGRAGVEHEGPYLQDGRTRLDFTDPTGTRLAIVADARSAVAGLPVPGTDIPAGFHLLGLGPALLEVGDAAAAGTFLGLLGFRSEEHTSELQSRGHLVCRLLLE